MTAQWFGDRAVLVSTDGPQVRELVAQTLEHQRESLGIDVLVRRGMRDVLVEASAPDLHLLDAVRAALARESSGGTQHPRQPREPHIDVRYEGQDLASASAALGVDVTALIAAHRRQLWRVAMLGFAPGFGYLEPVGDLTLEWSALDRLATPRARVPRGSVAVAAGMSAVYPQAMPGGWHLIGMSTAVLFDPERSAQPSLLAAGDLVRFVEVES